MNEKHLYGLDGLRFLAAAAVVMYHFTFRGEAAGEMPSLSFPAALEAVSSYGYLGVSLFFIISGFVIMYSAEGRTPIEFFTSRFVRIYPTFVLLMSLTAIVEAISNNPRFDVSIGQYLANLTMFPLILGQPFMDGAYWSIVLELIFYLWVFIVLMLNRIEQIERICALWLAASFFNEYYLSSEHLQNLFITEYSGFFVIGIVLQRIKQGVSVERVCLLVMGFAYAMFTTLRGAEWFEKTYHSDLSDGIIAAVLLIGTALFAAVGRMGIAVRYHGILKLLGGMTYPLYLFHQHAGYLALPALSTRLPLGMALGILLLGLALVSAIFHLSFERRWLPILRRRLQAVLGQLAQANAVSHRVLNRSTHAEPRGRGEELAERSGVRGL